VGFHRAEAFDAGDAARSAKDRGLALLTTNASKSARERLTLILPKDKLTAADIARPRLPDQTETEAAERVLEKRRDNVARTGEAVSKIQDFRISEIITAYQYVALNFSLDQSSK
jgi:hypothetical protein